MARGGRTPVRPVRPTGCRVCSTACRPRTSTSWAPHARAITRRRSWWRLAEGPLTALTWRADATQVEAGLRPWDWYVALIRAGAELHGLPEAHRRWLAAVPTQVDPDADRAAQARAVLEDRPREPLAIHARCCRRPPGGDRSAPRDVPGSRRRAPPWPPRSLRHGRSPARHPAGSPGSPRSFRRTRRGSRCRCARRSRTDPARARDGGAAVSARPHTHPTQGALPCLCVHDQNASRDRPAGA
jgi:hypothetical protein